MSHNATRPGRVARRRPPLLSLAAVAAAFLAPATANAANLHLVFYTAAPGSHDDLEAAQIADDYKSREHDPDGERTRVYPNLSAKAILARIEAEGGADNKHNILSIDIVSHGGSSPAEEQEGPLCGQGTRLTAGVVTDWAEGLRARGVEPRDFFVNGASVTLHASFAGRGPLPRRLLSVLPGGWVWSDVGRYSDRDFAWGQKRASRPDKDYLELENAPRATPDYTGTWSSISNGKMTLEQKNTYDGQGRLVSASVTGVVAAGRNDKWVGGKVASGAVDPATGRLQMTVRRDDGTTVRVTMNFSPKKGGAKDGGVVEGEWVWVTDDSDVIKFSAARAD